MFRRNIALQQEAVTTGHTQEQWTTRLTPLPPPTWCTWCRVGHSVLFCSLHYILLHSKKRMLHSFANNGKERKNAAFFCNKQKTTERMLRSFAKNGKNARPFRSFPKRTGERYILFSIYIYRNIYRYVEKRTEQSFYILFPSFFRDLVRLGWLS